MAEQDSFTVGCLTCDESLVVSTQDRTIAVAAARAFFSRHASCATTIDLTAREFLLSLTEDEPRAQPPAPRRGT